MRSHFYKRPGAVDHALRAAVSLSDAIEACRFAEVHLNKSGYKGAAIGVRQAALRLSASENKLLDAIGREPGAVGDRRLAAEILKRKSGGSDRN